MSTKNKIDEIYTLFNKCNKIIFLIENYKEKSFNAVKHIFGM